MKLRLTILIMIISFLSINNVYAGSIACPAKFTCTKTDCITDTSLDPAIFNKDYAHGSPGKYLFEYAVYNPEYASCFYGKDDHEVIGISVNSYKVIPDMTSSKWKNIFENYHCSSSSVEACSFNLK